jgi:hypothetical protein
MVLRSPMPRIRTTPAAVFLLPGKILSKMRCLEFFSANREKVRKYL